MKALILGTGGDKLAFKEFEKKSGSNHFGEYEYYQADDLIVLPRHKMAHSVAPHLINYRANIHALKDLECEEVISVYAVGSISDKLLPGEIGYVTDHIDMTHSRNNSFFDGTFYSLKHVNAENQFSRALQERIKKVLPAIKGDLIYVTTQGPRLETKAEIRAYKAMGCDVVGMTLSTEADLINELEIPNLAICYSINMAAGLSSTGLEFIGDDEVNKISQTIVDSAIKVLLNEW